MVVVRLSALQRLTPQEGQEDSEYCLRLSATVRLEELGKLKNLVTSGIEPATFLRVTSCIKQLCYRVPHTSFSNTKV
jgi:hypothetical protein